MNAKKREVATLNAVLRLYKIINGFSRFFWQNGGLYLLEGIVYVVSSPVIFKLVWDGVNKLTFVQLSTTQLYLIFQKVCTTLG